MINLDLKESTDIVEACDERFVPIQFRNQHTDLSETFWRFVARQSCYVHWKGIPMQKDPFQITITQQLIQDIKPKTIIEFGTFRGASAVWLADIQSLSVEDGVVFSVDITDEYLYSAAKNDPRLRLILGDSNDVEQIFSPDLIATFRHPILLVEDAHINTTGILEFFHNNVFKKGDYFIIEDTNIDYNNACYDVWKETMDEASSQNKLVNLNNKIIALEEWMLSKGGQYLVDSHYVDPFGIKNGSKNWNSVVKKVK